MRNQVITEFGKVEIIDWDSFFGKKVIERVEKNVGKKVNKNIMSAIIATGLALAFAAITQDVAMAADVHSFAYHGQDAVEVIAQFAPNGKGYAEPTKLQAILKFIDWLIFMVRWIVSSIIGLIASYAGYKWATDISGNGVAEAKKILKNCAVGVFWVQFGATIANYFVDKMASFI